MLLPVDDACPKRKGPGRFVHLERDENRPEVVRRRYDCVACGPVELAPIVLPPRAGA